MELAGIGFDPQTMSPIVLLKDSEEVNFLPIWVGMFEAAAIAIELQDVSSPRPMTHDLLIEIIERSNLVLTKVIINEVKDDTFYSMLEFTIIDDDGTIKKKFNLDARPSDAIAIAIRMDQSIYVSETVMIKAKLVNIEKNKAEAEQFKSFIDNLNPTDFNKYFEKK